MQMIVVIGLQSENRARLELSDILKIHPVLRRSIVVRQRGQTDWQGALADTRDGFLG